MEGEKYAVEKKCHTRSKKEEKEGRNERGMKGGRVKVYGGKECHTEPYTVGLRKGHGEEKIRRKKYSNIRKPVLEEA